MLGLGEEQPALDDEAERRAGHRQSRRGRRCRDATDRRDKGKQQRQPEGCKAGNGAQPYPMVARDAVAHFLQQVVVLRVRWFKQTHPAASAQRCRARHAARCRSGIDKAPVAFL